MSDKAETTSDSVRVSKALEGQSQVVSFSARAIHQTVRTRTWTGRDLQSPEFCGFRNTCSCPCIQLGGADSGQMTLQAPFHRKTLSLAELCDSQLQSVSVAPGGDRHNPS